jgi:hypothetical protein
MQINAIDGVVLGSFAAALVCIELSLASKRARVFRPLAYLFAMLIFVANEANTIIEHRSLFLVALGAVCIGAFGYLCWKSWAAGRVDGAG